MLWSWWRFCYHTILRNLPFGTPGVGDGLGTGGPGVGIGGGTGIRGVTDPTGNFAQV